MIFLRKDNMYLVSCFIDNFGGLRNFSYEFSKGINNIFNDNGWGKTTFAVFIRVMLYGFENENVRKNISVYRERNRYMPWAGGDYGGRLTVHYNDRDYLIIRKFGKKESEDEIQVIDLDTNLIVKEFGNNPGAVMLGLDKESFIKTVFIGHKDIHFDMTERLSNMLSVENMMDDNCNYENAIKLINSRINALSPRRATGEISKLEKKICEIGGRAAEIDKCNSAIQNYRQRIAKLNSETDECISTIRSLEDIQRKAIAAKNISDNSQEAVLLRAEYELAKNQFDCARMVFVDRTGKDSGEKIPDETAIKEIGLLQQKLSEMNEEAYESNKKNTHLSFVAVLVLAVAGALMLVNSQIAPGYVLLALCAFFAGSCLVTYFSGRNRTGQEKKNECERDEITAKINDFYSAYYMPDEISEKSYPMLYNEIQTDYNNYVYARDNLTRVELKVKEIENNAGNSAHSTDSLYQVTEEIRLQNEKILKMKDELSEVSNALNLQLEHYNDMMTDTAVVSSYREELGCLRHKYYIFEKTKEYIGMAREAFNGKNVQPIYHKFAEYVADFDADLSKQLKIDANAEVLVDAEGQFRSLRLMSQGYQALISLCLRLAIIDVLYEEGTFIIMDDPLIELDSKNCVCGLKLLDRISAKHQIIYFTCEEIRCI